MNVNGTNAPDNLFGTSKNDVIHGNNGGDLINAGQGVDKLWGDGGGDFFYFGDPSVGGDTTIKDFEPGDDLFMVKLRAYFDDVPDGPSFVFVEGGRRAGECDDVSVIYNPKNGRVFVDIDGHSSVKIATMQDGLELTKGDFFLYFY